jgi:HPt (histidine-containing phosphotransfer) domain-containing protein
MLTFLAIEVAVAIFIILNRSYAIMADLTALNQKVADLTQTTADMNAAVDAFITEAAANFAALKAAIANNDQPAIDAAVASLEAAHAALAAKKDAVVAATTADTL